LHFTFIPSGLVVWCKFCYISFV